mmetsp:Transcript_13459/g.44349  ORF Transcript_13459/g.44349 Transcript_13459/m.44349 type:complete len:245 (-) Transcript_13459:227-961(-)
MLRARFRAQFPRGGAGPQLPQASGPAGGAGVRRRAEARASARLRRHDGCANLAAKPPVRGGALGASVARRGPRKRGVHHLRARQAHPHAVVRRHAAGWPRSGARFFLAQPWRCGVERGAAGRDGRHRVERGGASRHGALHGEHGRVVHRGEGKRGRLALPGRGPRLWVVAGEGAARPSRERADQRARGGGERERDCGGEAARSWEGNGGGGGADGRQIRLPRVCALHRRRQERRGYVPEARHAR